MALRLRQRVALPLGVVGDRPAHHVGRLLGRHRKLTGWVQRKALAPSLAALGVGTWTGVKAVSMLRPVIGPAAAAPAAPAAPSVATPAVPSPATAPAANEGIASPASSAAWTCGDDRNWTSTRMCPPSSMLDQRLAACGGIWSRRDAGARR